MTELQADELTQDRADLLSESGPEVSDPLEALRLLAALAEEGDDLLAEALAGEPADPGKLAEYHRRRAYVWARVADKCPPFEDVAEAEIQAWQTAEAARTTVGAAAGESRP